jgi:hypothetical protein
MEREREGGKKRMKVERKCGGGDGLVGVICGKWLVCRLKVVSECDNEGRRWV